MSGLPECLQDLDPETLKLLVQDVANFQAILDDDGSVNPFKVDMLRRGELVLPSLQLPHIIEQQLQHHNNSMIHSFDLHNTETPMYLDPLPTFQQQQQRFDPIFDDRRPVPLYDGPPASMGYQPAHALDLDDRYVAPQPLVRGNFTLHSRETPGFVIEHSVDSNASHRPLAVAPRLAPTLGSVPAASLYGDDLERGASSSRSSVGGFHRESNRSFDTNRLTGQANDEFGFVSKSGKRFPTTKAATPCKFYNTSKGCQFGDKCAFGHFDEAVSSSTSSLQSSRSVRRTSEGHNVDSFGRTLNR